MGIQIMSYTMRYTLGSLIRTGSAVTRSAVTRSTMTRSTVTRSTGARTFVSSTGVCFSEDKKQSSGSTTGIKSTESKAESEEIPDVILKEVPDAKHHWEYQQSSEEAQVYDRKPVKVKCTEGKVYMWCACGHSHRQPFCDGTHRLPILKFNMKPVPWKCLKTGYYWFCQCKKTNKKPFCDGTHLDIPDNTITTIKY